MQTIENMEEEKINEEVQKIWTEKKCPSVNGVIFANGDIHLYELIDEKKSVIPGKYHLSSIEQIKTLDLESTDTDICPSYSCTIDEFKIAYCGDTSWGSEGFVAVYDKAKGKLDWIAIFDESNPFEGLVCSDKTICACSTLGNKWIFSVDGRATIKVEVAY